MDLTTTHVAAACLAIAILFLTTRMITLLLLQRRRRNLNQKEPALPPVVSGISLIASVPVILSKGLPAVIHSLHTKLGTVFTISIFGVKKVITFFLVGPEAIPHFFQGSESEISQSTMYKITVPVFGRGVMYDVDLTTRSRQISFCIDAIKPVNLRSLVDAMAQEDYFAQWGQHGVIDLKHEIGNLILLITGRCLLGKHIRDNMFDQVAPLFNELFHNSFFLISLFFPHLPIPAHRRRDKARAKLGDIIHEVVRSRRSSGLAENDDDVLQRLVDAKYSNGQALTESEIAGILVALVVAGQHTSSSNSVWTGACLLSNGGREHLAAAMDEQKEIVGRHGERLDYSILQEMGTLHCCIKEALRMHPSSKMLMRHASKGFSVRSREGHTYGIPKGHTLVTCTTVGNSLPYIFKDPHVYDPSRFGAGREEDKVGGKFCYTPFGSGRHVCPGEHYAYMQMKVIWSHLLRNFDLELVSPFPEEEWEKLFSGPRGKVMVSYKKAYCSSS